MCVCLCVCVCVCVCARVYVCVYVCVYAEEYKYVYSANSNLKNILSKYFCEAGITFFMLKYYQIKLFCG